jgi:hypothetical protein
MECEDFHYMKHHLRGLNLMPQYFGGILHGIYDL